MKKYLIASSIAILALVSIASAQNFTFSNDLSVNSSGPDVSALQSWLVSNGYDIPAISSGAASKGFFGSQTRMALMKYQYNNGIPNTGYFGPMTRGRINGIYHPPVGPLNITSPNGGESWQIGTTHNITWTSPLYIRATYANLQLIPYYQPCTGRICPMTADSSVTPGSSPSSGSSVQSMMYPYRAPYTIASNISINQNSYSWNVGNVISPVDYIADTVNGGRVITTIPAGQYTIQICEVNSSNCESSDAPFTIYSNTSTSRPPVVSGIDAPTTLLVNQTGTWTVRATDPQNGTLSYSVDWGDTIRYAEVACPMGYTCSPKNSSVVSVQQGSTFTHSYSSTGTYTVRFIVKNSLGLSVQSSVTVQVVPNSSVSPNVISPNGGEVWQSNSTHQIVWYMKGITDVNTKIDIYLDKANVYCIAMVGANCGGTYILDKNIPISTIYNWIVATDVNNVAIPTGDYKVRICTAGSTTNCDSSDSYFSIAYQY